MFYIKICSFLGNISRHNLIKIYTKTHQTAPHLQNVLGEVAFVPEPSSIYVQP